MRTFISVPLAALFVFLAGFNAWTMLTGRGASPRSRGLWTRAHRICGYSFITLFVIFCYFMLLRVRGSSDELSPRLILHMGLAVVLVPLLFVKVIVVRYQRAAWGLVIALGTSIFITAFTLVAVNVSIHYLRLTDRHRVPLTTSLRVVAVVVILATIAFLAKAKPGEPKAHNATSLIAKHRGESVSGSGGAFNLILARTHYQTPDAKTLRFLLPQGCHLMARPGQFLTFEWMIDGRPLVRSYSICSSPTQQGFVEITAKRVENGCVSAFLNDRAKVGLIAKARGPYGKFCFDENKHQRIVLIAGGSGITPMISMLRYLDDLCIAADVTLIYCVRSQQDVFFKDEFAALQQRMAGFSYVLVLSQPGPEWNGWKGRLRHEILEREVRNPGESTFFLCGPPAFMENGRSLLKDLNVEPSRILQESFGGAIAGEATSISLDGRLRVTFSRSQVACPVSSEETLLESSERNGVLIPSGCRQGACGTCATRLLSGRVHMETEEALNEELRSRGFILPCVSRPLSDVTLDA